MKTIRVTGTAQLKLRPDVTVVTMTLQGTEPEYSKALNRASREAETLREEYLRPYNRASGEKERNRIVAELEERLKRLAE